jgi:aerobic carbon-monoxide dehydrogenase medium subunit
VTGLGQFEYTVAATLDQAVRLLSADPTVRALAGGNGLLTLLKRGELAASRLVDLRSLGELRGISATGDGRIRVGAMTTLTELLADPTVRAAHGRGVLGDAVALAGDPQTRNRATVGGTLASAAAGSDLSAALLALDATASVAGPRGSRVTPVAHLLSGVSSLGGGELITAVELAPAEPGSAYLRLGSRATLHAVCGVAVTAAVTGGVITRCRVAVTGAMTHPQRLTEVETAVTGTRTPVTVPEQPAWLFVTDQDASARYRAHVAKVLAERAFTAAVARARAV